MPAIRDVSRSSAQGMHNASKLTQNNVLHQDPTEFALACRSTYLRIDLDVIWQNIQILKAKCASHTKVIAVIKSNAYGHGSVGVAKYLNNRGIFHFAVATVLEGTELRENGVLGYIQVFGNCVEEEIDTLLEYNLTPTVTNLKFIANWAARTNQPYKNISNKIYSNGTVDCSKPSVVIKIDTGMSRNGCQCDELSLLMDACESHQVPVHSIMTHFAQAWDDPKFTKEQLDTFLETTKVYRSKGVKVHAANSAAIIKGFGSDLDFVRPGIAIYGLAPDSSPETTSVMQALRMRPALSWVAKPSLIKSLDAGRKVGYDQAYRLVKPERIATFNFGYADGYNRLLSNKGVLTDINGKVFEIVGRVSMDAVTVRVDDNVTIDTPFYVIKDDYKSPNSAGNIARMLETISYEIGTSLSSRLPRIFVTQEEYSL